MRVFLMFSSANRDEACFQSSERFDITRDTSKSIAFGAGPHICAGAFASKALVGRVALPRLFERLSNLRLDERHPVYFDGLGVSRPLEPPGFLELTVYRQLRSLALIPTHLDIDRFAFTVERRMDGGRPSADISY